MFTYNRFADAYGETGTVRQQVLHRSLPGHATLSGSVPLQPDGVGNHARFELL